MDPFFVSHAKISKPTRCKGENEICDILEKWKVPNEVSAPSESVYHSGWESIMQVTVWATMLGLEASVNFVKTISIQWSASSVGSLKSTSPIYFGLPGEFAMMGALVAVLMRSPVVVVSFFLKLLH